MLTPEVVEKVNAKKNGAMIGITYSGDLSKYICAKAKKNGTTVTKLTSAVVRKGISYENQKSVIEKVENGKVLTHELPWGTWSEKYENIIEHKGHEYLRLYFGSNEGISAPKTKYFVNGVETSYDELKALGVMVNSFFTKKSEKPDAITIMVDNIVAIK